MFLYDLSDYSVATGSKYHHKLEEETLVKDALGIHIDEKDRPTSKGVN
jgi:hypothetical protein